MDELWQLKAACPNRASSQIFPLSVPLNQTETVPDPCMHPYLAQEVCIIERTERTIRQEPISSNMLNLGSQSFYPKGGWSEFSNPFLASWSGNSQQLRSVFQQIPSSRPSLLPLNQQLYSTSASNASYTGCWPGNSPSLGQDPGLAALQTAVCSHTGQGRDSSRIHDNMESAMLRSNGLDMCKKALSVSHHASEPDLHSQLAVLPWLSDDRHQRVQRTQAKQQFSLEKNMQPVLDASFSLNNPQPCGPLGSKPRVYCPSLSGSLIGGELILTETGRLGVSCLCHNLLMSVAKFSEHAGLLTVNPGSIVQMEGGESLVQWRKMFFSQFKVKVPEDHLGWDWNDVSSLEMAHASQKTVLAQSCRKDIGLCFQDDSLVVKNRASQVWDTSAPLRNSWSTGNVTSKAGLIAMNPCQKGSQDVCESALKTAGQSFNESTEIRRTPNELLLHNIHGNISRHKDPVVNSPLQGNEVKGSPASECIELIKKINKSYIPEMNTSFSFPRKNLQMGVGLSGRSHGQDAVQLGKDLMTSNFELRLGQPSQQTLSHGPSFSRSSESALSAVGIWDQSSQQCSRPSSSRCINGCTGGGGLRQSSEGVQILNYCNDMKMNGELQTKHVPAENAEDDRVVAASNQMQPVIICYANNPSMFADSCKGSDGQEQFRNKMNALAVRPLAQSSEVPQLLKNRAIDKHHRGGISSLDQENFTNQIRNGSPAESVNVLGSAQTQSSVLHVKPRIERSDCRKSAVSSYFPPHSTLSDKLSVSLTGPAERESSTLESVAVKNSVNQRLASSLRSCDGSQIAQIKGGVHGATSEGLSASSWNQLQEHTSSRLFQMIGKEHDQQARVSVDSGKLETAGQNLSGSTAGVSDISMTLMQARKPSDHRELYPPEGIEEKKDLSNVSHGDVAKPVLEKPCSVQGESVLQFENKNTCNRAYLGENDPADHCQLKSEKSLPYCKDVEQEGQTLAMGDKGLDRDAHQEECQFMEIHKCSNVASAKIRGYSKESGCKELICNDIIDEGSGIGKCSSYGDTDISARTKVEHCSVDAHPKVQDGRPTCWGHSIKSDKVAFNNVSRSGKLMENKSKTMKLPADSEAKELFRNNAVDEGSSVGKCCSSDEVDMDVRTSMMPVSMGEHEPVWESPPFMECPSSSDANVSETLANTCHASKLQGCTAVMVRQELVSLKSDYASVRTEKRRKAMKWKRLDVASPSEKSRQNDSVRGEDKGAVGSFGMFHDPHAGRKVFVSDTCVVPSEKNLKRKRSWMKKKAASKPVQERLETDGKAVLNLKGAKQRSEEKSRKLVIKLSHGLNEKLLSIDRAYSHEKFHGTLRFANNHDAISKPRNDKTCSGVEVTSLPGKKYMMTSNNRHEEKAKELSNSDAYVKGERSLSARKNSKVVKMALLSDLLKLPGEKRALQLDQKTIAKGIEKPTLELKAAKIRDLPYAKTQCIGKSCVRERIILATTGRDVRKRSLWELTSEGRFNPAASQIDLMTDPATQSTAKGTLLTEYKHLGHQKPDGKKWCVIHEGDSLYRQKCQSKDGVGPSIGNQAVLCGKKLTIQSNPRSHKCDTVVEGLYIPDQRIHAAGVQPFRTSESVKKMDDFKIPLKLRKKKRNASKALTTQSVSFPCHDADQGSSLLRFSKKLKSQDGHLKIGCNQIAHSVSRGCLPTVERFGLKWDKGSMKHTERDGRSKSVQHRKLKKLQYDLESSGRADCCVCGSSSSDCTNALVQCNRCHIKVHQACYGVVKVPKSSWVCRPCKAHAMNIVCVLCGYGQGAMTRAKKTQAFTKGFLQAWQEEKNEKRESRLLVTNTKELISENIIFRDLKRNLSGSNQYSEGLQTNANWVPDTSIDKSMCRKGEYNRSFLVKVGIKDGIDENAASFCKETFMNVRGVIGQDWNGCKNAEPFLCNSVVSAVNNPNVTQWVHTVCALWMPGTRCLNVGTMAAFDVSGVTRARRKMVCSICKRPGGACIQCREAKCSTPFHPWCAHWKGLLQSESFGGHGDKVGFFGRCMLHGKGADEQGEMVELAEVLPETSQSCIDKSTCARTEGYRRQVASKKRTTIIGELRKYIPMDVSREQILSWLRIKDRKTCSRRFIKHSNSDLKTDRREYLQFKQERGWKRLAVYKSNIHALGLYTAERITKGEMVVEYVGEIVGLHVADKREAVYCSNNSMGYKRSCFFFRIDNENIIDATWKGGIARFMNHSCSPNCVAKVVFVQDQKKVVFFAERDISAGEEITYDYKSSYDKESTVSCFCNSAKCRGYFNKF